MKSSSFSRRSLSRAVVGVLLITGAAACSLINALDEVKPSVVEATDSGAADVAVDAGSDAAVSGGKRGVIVVAGSVNSDSGLKPVVTALNPEDGTELPKAREALNVMAVQYDGARDLWYVFESSGAGYFPTPEDSVFLHVRELDPVTGAWTERQSLKVPTLVSFTSVSVINERLVYVAYREGNDGFDLVNLSTSDPTNIVRANAPQPIVKAPIGLLGFRGTGKGGAVNFLNSVACDAGATCLELEHVTVPPENEPAFGTPVSLGLYTGSPAYGTWVTGVQDIVGWAEKVPNASLRSYSPQNQQPISSISFQTNDAFLKPLAFSECLGQALVVGTNQDLAVAAIPLTTAGKQARQGIQHSGQGVYYEPYTSTVLVPFSQGDNFELTAMKLGGTKAEPTLASRTAGWTPPKDLRPEFIATRTPIPFECPTAPATP